jgi:hypothetical protein
MNFYYYLLINHRKFLIIYLIFFILGNFVFSCSQNASMSDEIIIAKIGNKTITRDEFLNRAEYTIRPGYCRQNSLIDKKIILNSLVAEKLLALEAGENSLLYKNETFQAFIQGRKEQAMRQWLYYTEAYNPVTLTDYEISNLFQRAGRKYELNYFNVSDSTIAYSSKTTMKHDTLFFPKLYQQLYGQEKLPTKQISWQDNQDAMIEDSLYSNPLKKGQIIGPIKIDQHQFMFIKIKSWTDEKAVGSSDIQKRWDEVKKRLTQKKADIRWNQFVGKIMTRKQVRFQENTFFQLVELFADKYLGSKEEEENRFNQQFWNQSGDLIDQGKLLTEMEKEQQLMTKPFFTLDDQTWNVRDFKKMLASHPLVFRNRRISRRDFPQQFKLAVVDLIADHYITQEAYSRSLDKEKIVQENVSLWEDATLGLFQRNRYLESIKKKEEFLGNYMNVLKTDLNPYIQNLQKKYNDVIKINIDEFNKISLTRIDMFVIQKFDAYPIITPTFPIVTSEHKLNYGHEMKNTNFTIK